MGVLVPDHHPDPAEVHRVVHAPIEEGRLEDAGREHDLVVRRVVIGVHGGGGHAPERAVRRLVDPLVGPLDLEHLRATGVAEVVVAPHLDRAVVLPVLGVAHLARVEGPDHPHPGQ